ncbi:hypothetical protein MMC25_007789 [Agyrium rufum]|nr:hypothetical protein [Agyrium rufum]
MAPVLFKTDWYKDEYLISTSHSLLQVDVVNKAFGSDYMYWTKPLENDALGTMLSNSLCFGVYALPESTSEIAGRATPIQIGLGRVITDYSTFAYLTDVFIIPEFRGRGLGKWLVNCINETLEAWPNLRSAMLFSSGENAKRFYESTLGMKTFKPGVDGLEIMNKRGRGNVFDDV